MRLGMRKTIGDPEAENLPEGFTATVTTTSGMVGSYLSNFHVEVNSFTKVILDYRFSVMSIFLGQHSWSFWTHVLRRQVDRSQQIFQERPC